MLLAFLIGLLIGIAFFFLPIVIGMALFFILIKRFRDGINRRDEDSI
jgi:hypothetical protein